jgi:phage-related protein
MTVIPYRAVYTVRLTGRVYVLHAFQKQARHGISTPNVEIDRIRARLRKAEEHHAVWLMEQKGQGGHG